MCGRFTLFAPGDVLARMFGVDDAQSLAPRYNIAPSQPVAAARVSPDSGGRELTVLRWGLVPSWAKDPSAGDRMINARADTVSEKPSFRSAFRRRRCLVPADGFYEWKRVAGRKQPFYVRFRDGRPFAIASLWERWEGPDGSVLESCALVTTDANDIVSPIHDRMPVILAPKDYALWLDPALQAKEALLPLLCPFPPEDMTAFPVHLQVNNPKVDNPACIEPLAPRQ